MGSGVSVVASGAPETTVPSFPLKKIAEQIEEALYVHERFCVILDPEEMACRYLKYQLGTFIASDDIEQTQHKYLNRALVGAMRFGRTLTLKFQSLEGVNKDELFKPEWFPVELLNRDQFLRDTVWQTVLKPELGDPSPDEMVVSTDFAFIICVTQSAIVPRELAEVMHVFQIADKVRQQSDAEAGAGAGAGGDPMEEVASLLGGAEIVRNSPQLVEAAFDGDLDEIKSWMDKGFHIESSDGRKHTALSEAASQGHIEVVKFLLEQGADPNALSDTCRSPLWRAAFSGQIECCRVLLAAGSNPEYRDKTSMESAFDVARTDVVRELLSTWDVTETERLMAARKRLVMQKIEERIQTAQQREEYARQKIRLELVDHAERGDWDGIKEILLMVAEESEKTGGRPRASADCRSDSGQSLLSIAAQNDHVDLATHLLTHWRQCDKDRWDLPEGELSVEAKVFRVNVNARDMRGWNCACISVFHTSLKTLAVLLDHGADCNMRSMYNKNAHDLAKDECDAAGNVVTSRAEVRAVIMEHDTSGAKSSALFGTGSGISRDTNLYQDLGEQGSPIVMQIEMAKEIGSAAAAGGGGGGGGKAKGKAAGGAGSKAKGAKGAGKSK